VLFAPLDLRGVTLRNRVGVSPMCQYAATDGLANDWHFVHTGALATGGAALVMTEATAVSPEGRISAQDLGLWSDAHVPGLRRITEFVKSQGAIPGIQLAHAGRKASTRRPWEGGGVIAEAEGGWIPLGPSAVPYSPTHATPREMTAEDVKRVVVEFRAATGRAHAAGYEVLEIHTAHGYLLHEFLSPKSNHRGDAYGGSFDHRARLALEIVEAVRGAWPAPLPLFVRLSVTEWCEGGWDVPDSIRLGQRLRELGVDLIDCSSGGNVSGVQVPLGPGYQVPLARAVREGVGIPTAAVGLITDAVQANEIVRRGDADLVLLARELLRQPRWPLLAAARLGESAPWPPQYERARPR
jgi:2,4-dienoyl-CoA reductase-like NADH-dependent reductase (Old Yellow Enzyme family)